MMFPSDAIDVSEHTLQELEQQCLLYSVYLEVYDRSGTVIGEATGGIIHPDGYVLTCHHVVNAKNNEVDLFGDNTVRISATVNTPGAIGGDTRKFECEMLAPQFRDCDMALLRMKGSNFPYASLRPAEQPVQALEKTLLSGYPLGKRLAGGSKDTLRGNLFRGEISSVMEVKCEDGTIERCYLDGRGLHGNSGSPVFSAADGRMIGVFSGSVRPNQKTNPDELNFFYPIRYFWERFTQLPADDRTESAAAAPAEAENAADAAEAADNAAASKAAEQGGGHHGKREEDA